MKVELSPADQLTVLTAGAAASKDGRLPVPVSLESADVDYKAELAVKGGNNLDLLSGSAECTSGFSVRGGGQDGLATAMHCQNSLTYNGTSGIIQYANAAGTTPTGNHIDIQWHRTINGNTASPRIKTGESGGGTPVERTITSAANPTVGSFVCHYGRTSGARCTYVDTLGECYTPSNLTFCALVKSYHLYISGR